MKKNGSAQWLLLVSVMVIATCGLIYELVAGTLASYLLGDSVTQFSTIIGVYLFSMGIGSFLSKFFREPLLTWFIRIELMVGLVGGFSAPILFLVFPLTNSFQPVLYGFVVLTGTLVGLEIPLLMRILKDKVNFRDLVSRVFTFDYMGALLASLVFPLLLVPHLGLIRTSLLFGMMNLAIGWYLAYFFSDQLRRAGILRLTAIFLLFIELGAFVFSENIMAYSETMAFRDPIVYSQSSPYQRIVITKSRHETRLYLNGNLQFSSADEYRYHEALVHPALSSIDQLRTVLVLGGGDGMAVREILKYPSVREVTLVDLDPKMTELFRSQKPLVTLNQQSLSDPRVHIHNTDAFVWLKENTNPFDAIIIDFPDPSSFSIGKLYSTLFYHYVRRSLAPNGIVTIHSTSPYVAPRSFWCIDSTIRSQGFYTRPYHNMVPSFGEWGYIMASPMPRNNWFQQLPDSLRFLNRNVLESLFIFPDDMKNREPIEVNRLNNQVLVRYFEEEWSKYLE